MTENTENKELAPIGKHHRNSPSTLKRRELCPKSYTIESLVDTNIESDYSNRGTRIHAAVAYSLDAMKKGISPSETLKHETLSSLSDEELECHDAIIDFMKQEIVFNGFDVQDFMIEQFVEYKNISGVLYYGTCDLVIVNKSLSMAWIYDWKTGFRLVDDASDNLQGAGYALAVSQTFGVDNVCVTFFNPTRKQHTSFTFDAENIMAIAVQIETIINKCLSDDAYFYPGEEQCRNCTGALTGTCHAYLAQFNATAEIAKRGTALPISELEDNALVYAFEQCKAVEKLKTAIETELKLRINATGKCAGYTLKSSSGGREAQDLDGIFSVANKYYSPEEFMNFCTLSLSKLEKDIAKKMKASGESLTEKEAKEKFAIQIAEFISNKPTRQVLTPPPPVIQP